MKKTIGMNLVTISEKELKRKFINLIKRSGNNALYTFDFCSTRGFELNDSTIDKFELGYYYGAEDIRIVYNENEYDYDWYDKFNAEELVEFYNALILYIYDDNALNEDNADDKDTLAFLENEVLNEYFIESSIDDYKDTPTSDLFALVATQASKETILSVAEGYIGDENIREFLFACLGFNIE